MLEAHKACFDKLVLILDITGLMHFFTKMAIPLTCCVRLTITIESSQIALKVAMLPLDKPTLNKAEQLLLNKTSIGFLQECHKLCQISKDLANKQSDLDNFLNEQTGNFIALKTHFFSKIYNL